MTKSIHKTINVAEIKPPRAMTHTVTQLHVTPVQFRPLIKTVWSDVKMAVDHVTLDLFLIVK